MDKGTLYQVKNLLNHSAVPKDPGNNMKATEDFMEVVLTTFVIVAAKTIIQEHQPLDKEITVHELAELVVDRFVPFLDEKNHSATSIERGDEDITESNVEKEEAGFQMMV